MSEVEHLQEKLAQVSEIANSRAQLSSVYESQIADLREELKRAKQEAIEQSELIRELSNQRDDMVEKANTWARDNAMRSKSEELERMFRITMAAVGGRELIARLHTPPDPQKYEDLL